MSKTNSFTIKSKIKSDNKKKENDKYEMKLKQKIKISASKEISNTDNFYLVQERCCDCGDWHYIAASGGDQLVVFTEEAFNTLNKGDEMIYTKYSNIAPILEVAIRINTPEIIFSTSENMAMSFLVSQFVE